MKNHLLPLVAIIGGVMLGTPSSSVSAEPVSVTGNLLLEAKGEVEVYYNGRKLVLRDKPDNKQHYNVKVPARAFKAGDTIVLHVYSPVVYRAIVAAINLTPKGGQIAIKKSHWKYLGESKDAGKITAAEVEACPTNPVSAAPDPEGDAGRKKLGIVPESQGGSDWVKSEKQLNESYCVGFVLTEEMLKTPLPTRP